MSKRLPRYSIRKLTIGAASVLIGVAFAGAASSGTVKAADTGQTATTKVEEKIQSIKPSQLQESKTNGAKAADPQAVSKSNNQPNASANEAKQAVQPVAKTGHEQAVQSKPAVGSKPEDAKKAPDQKASTKTPVKAADSTQKPSKVAPTSKKDDKQEAADQTKPDDSKETKTDKIDQTVLKKLAKDAKASDVKIKDEKLKSETQYQERTVTVHYVYGHGTGMDESLRDANVFDDAVLKLYYVNTGTAEHPVWKFDSSYNKDGYANGYKIVSGSWTTLPTDNSGSLFVSTPDLTKNGNIYIPTLNRDGDGNVIDGSANEFVNPDYSGSAQSGSSIAFTNHASNYASQAVHTVYYERKSGKSANFTINWVDDDDLDASGHPKLIYSKKVQDSSGRYTDLYGDNNFWSSFNHYDENLINNGNVPGNYEFVKVTSDKADPSILRQSGNTPFSIPLRDWTYWAAPNYDWTIDQENSMNEATFTIHLKHGLRAVEKDVTRTINVSYPDHYQSVSQKVVFTNQQDVVTGKMTEDWQLQGSNIWPELSFPAYDDIYHTITITDSQGNVLKDSSGKNLRSISQETNIDETTPDQTLNVSITNLQVDFTIKVVDEKTGDEIAHLNVTNTNNDNWSGVTFTKGYTHDPYYFDYVESSTGDPEIAKVLRQDGDVVFKGPNSKWWNPNWSWNNSGHSDAPHLTPQQIYNMAGSTFTIYVKHKTVNITLNNSEIDRTYTGKAQTIQDIPDDINFPFQAKSDNDEVQPYSNPNDVHLTKDDFSFADENGNLIDPPINAGTYRLVLNDNGLKKFKDCDSSFNWNYDSKNSYITYTIKKAQGTATLSGTVQQDYNGQAISNLSPIKVTVDYPNTDNQTTYTLQNGDYEFVKDGQTYTTAPSDAGTYTIELTDQGKANIAKLGNPTGHTNVDWSYTGTGQYTIKPASKVIVHYYDDTNADTPIEIASQAKDFSNTDANPGSFNFDLNDFTKNWNYQQAGWSFEKQTPVSDYPTTGTKSADGNYYVADYKIYLKVNSPLKEKLTRHIAYVDDQGNPLTAADDPAPSDQTLKASRTYSINSDGSVKLSAWTVDSGNEADFAREFDAPATITDAAGNKYDLDFSNNHYSASAKLGDTDVNGVITANNGKFVFAGNLADLAKADSYRIILPYKMEDAAMIVHYIDITGKTASSSGWQPSDGTPIKTASSSAAPNSTYAKPSWNYAANGWILVQDANWPAKSGLGGSKTDVYVYLKKKSTKPDNPVGPDNPDNPNNPDQPIIPDNPVNPINPINQERQEDLIFVTPTGQVVLRVANGISGLANHDLSQAQVISLINKYLPQGWQLLTGFVAKAIQVNGLSSFITVVPAKAQTMVYFVLGNGKIIKKTVWKINADQANQNQKIAFAKANLPAGYQLVEIGQSHSVALGKRALFITVAPKRAVAPKSEQNLVFATHTGQRIKTVSNHSAIAPKHIINQQTVQKYLPKGYKISQKQPVKMTDQEITVTVVPDKEQK